MTRTIDLGRNRAPSSRVLAGRTKGEAAREKARLDFYDTTEDIVPIVVPSDIRSVNSSFFLGMFGRSINLLKEEGFREKYPLCGEHVREVYEYSIRVALANKSVLPSHTRKDAQD